MFNIKPGEAIEWAISHVITLYLLKALSIALFLGFLGVTALSGFIFPHEVNTSYVDDKVYHIEKQLNKHGFDYSKKTIMSGIESIYKYEFKPGPTGIKFTTMRKPDVWIEKGGLSQNRANLMAALFDKIW